MAIDRRQGVGGLRSATRRPARASDVREAELQTAQERFRLATEALVGFLYDYDLATGHVERFGGMEEVVGFKPAAIPSTPDWWIERIHPEDRPRIVRASEQAFESDAAGYAYEYRMRHRRGHYIYVGDRARIIRDQAGRVVRILGGVSDISDRKWAEEALRDVTRRLDLALKGSGIGVWELELTDGTIEHGRVLYTNAREQLGYDPAELPADVDDSIALIHPADRESRFAAYRSLLAGETERLEFEHRLRHRDGSYRTMLVRGVPIRDAAGKHIRIIGSRVDITERKRAEAALHASEERFRLAVDALTGFVYDWDLIEDKVRYFGRTQEVLGFRLDELPQDGAWWRSRIHPEDIPPATETRGLILTGNLSTWVLEYRMQHREGHYVDVVSRGHVVRDCTGRVTRVIGGVSDVTERRRSERERNALLEREREARAVAEAAIRSRDDLLTVVYHDLGAPLSAIALCASALSESREPTVERVQEVVGAIRRSTDWMQRLISDLMDAASIQGAGLSVELRDEAPAPILEAIAELFAQEARTRGVLLETRIPLLLPRMRADGDRVLQALANLLNNALKFTEPGGRITLRAHPEPGSICFSVEDTGVGISAEDLPHIFDRYWHKHHRSEGGRGLGLAIVKGIVNAHGGRLDVESVPGKGSRFSFAIPTA